MTTELKVQLRSLEVVSKKLDRWAVENLEGEQLRRAFHLTEAINSFTSVLK